MTINTKNLVSITEANQNFSKVARMVDENGTVIILKNNVPRYMIVEFRQAEEEAIANDEDVALLSARLIAKTAQPMRNLRNDSSDETTGLISSWRSRQGNRRQRRIA